MDRIKTHRRLYDETLQPTILYSNESIGFFVNTKLRHKEIRCTLQIGQHEGEFVELSVSGVFFLFLFLGTGNVSTLVFEFRTLA